jgi:hypothetical protein
MTPMDVRRRARACALQAVEEQKAAFMRHAGLPSGLHVC